jgi:hypothetical protein
MANNSAALVAEALLLDATSETRVLNSAHSLPRSFHDYRPGGRSSRQATETTPTPRGWFSPTRRVTENDDPRGLRHPGLAGEE